MPCRTGWMCALLAALVGCTGQVSSGGAGVLVGTDGGPDAVNSDGGPGDGGAGVDGGTVASSKGTVTGALRTDNFGWRPADTKIAVLLGQAGAAVQLIDASTGAVAGSFTSTGALQTDPYSGDSYSTVDFSSFSTAGDYYLYVPALSVRSYGFRISPDIYDVVGAASVKAYYFQRCNHDKALPFATDALLGYSAGGQWVDGACHATDANAPAGPGSADNGPLDVHGGWHDAGDYQKTLWGRGVPQMLFAYEVNPGAWTDGQLHIPESGNGIPDLLDEVRWELDFYVRMQRPDGHFMTSTKGNNPTVTSPPSASNEGRVYFDCTSPSGNGWSGEESPSRLPPGMPFSPWRTQRLSFEASARAPLPTAMPRLRWPGGSGSTVIRPAARRMTSKPPRRPPSSGWTQHRRRPKPSPTRFHGTPGTG